MKNATFLFLLFFLIHNQSFSQWGQRYQYFDGNDTLPGYSIFIHFTDSSDTVWQVGPPQKPHFNSAYSNPNVIMTDTILAYPDSGRWSFYFYVDSLPFTWSSIMAIQWVQKLDLKNGEDGGVVEFSLDSGQTWQNAFNNPLVYSFYGFNWLNVDTLPSGSWAFTGTDTTWRDIWLCFDIWYLLSQGNSFSFRYTLESNPPGDSLDGWMIDNLSTHLTFVHTIDKAKQMEELAVSPNPGSDRINIQVKKDMDHRVIKEISLRDSEGKIVYRVEDRPLKTWIDVSHLNEGVYFLQIITNKGSETEKILIKK